MLVGTGSPPLLDGMVNRALGLIYVLVDNECATLLAEGPLDTRIDYPTRVFSRKSGEEFLEYLKAIETRAGPDHTALVARVYGPEWTRPYRTMLEDERARRTRSGSGTTPEQRL